ncbi:MAG: type II secretion system protein M [Nitrosomonadales bacterium]|nr:type II secretion system protein M [Nitrosomonadales bacterium]
MSPNNLLNQSRQSFAEFWMARNARERAMLAAATAVVALGLIFATMIDPALTGREHLNNNLPVLRQQTAQMQALSKEASALSGTSAPTLAAITKESIETALARKGLKPQSVMLTGNLAKVQLVAVSFASTLNWLDDMQRTALLSVVDANIVALSQADTVDVTLTLRQQRNE